MWKSIMAAFSPQDSAARKERILRLERKVSESRNKVYTEVLTLDDVTRKVLALFEDTDEPPAPRH